MTSARLRHQPSVSRLLHPTISLHEAFNKNTSISMKYWCPPYALHIKRRLACNMTTAIGLLPGLAALFTKLLRLRDGSNITERHTARYLHAREQILFQAKPLDLKVRVGESRFTDATNATSDRQSRHDFMRVWPTFFNCRRACFVESKFVYFHLTSSLTAKITLLFLLLSQLSLFKLLSSPLFLSRYCGRVSNIETFKRRYRRSGLVQ